MSGFLEILYWWVLGLSIGVIWFYVAGQLFLVALHVILRRRALRQEAAILAQPLPDAASLPHVVVQLPVYNEGKLVRRALTAAAALEWPEDKLHIQVLDDSTDDSAGVSAAAADEFRAGGLDVAFIHRDNRQEFKAGALREAMDAVEHPYFVIFDADYIPPPDFVANCMKAMLQDESVGFVQGRFDFLNADANWLTRGQTMMLDAHLAIEQATRSWAGFFFPFNGTCGVWRRQAIEEAGGWHGGTLAEDMELSYRVWAAGWRGRYLTTVAAPGELPATLAPWVSQQRRWVRGSGQASRRFVAKLLGFGGKAAPGTAASAGARHSNVAADAAGKPRRRGRSLSALWHASAWWSVPASAAMFALALAGGILMPDRILLIAGVLGVTILGTTVMTLVMHLVATQTLRPSKGFGKFFTDHLCFWLIGIAFPFVGIRTLVESVLDLGSSFERTPKRGT